MGIPTSELLAQLAVAAALLTGFVSQFSGTPAASAGGHEVYCRQEIEQIFALQDSVAFWRRVACALTVLAGILLATLAAAARWLGPSLLQRGPTVIATAKVQVNQAAQPLGPPPPARAKKVIFDGAASGHVEGRRVEGVRQV